MSSYRIAHNAGRWHVSIPQDVQWITDNTRARYRELFHAEPSPGMQCKGGRTWVAEFDTEREAREYVEGSDE